MSRCHARVGDIVCTHRSWRCTQDQLSPRHRLYQTTYHPYHWQRQKRSRATFYDTFQKHRGTLFGNRGWQNEKIMKEQSVRIQTSVLNGVEKKVLIHLARLQPKWMTSDILTFIGVIGAALGALGYILSNFNIAWLWLSSAGYIINWYGDSLDGTLARVRHTQRPIYGFYIDHCVDGVTTAMICIGAGLSQIMNLGIAMSVLALYLLLSISVYINAHLKGEFKLTYAGMGPTELRLIMIIVNTLYICVAPIRNFSIHIYLLGKDIVFGSFDIVAVGVIIFLVITYIFNFFADAKGYAEVDPLPKWNGQLY